MLSDHFPIAACIFLSHLVSECLQNKLASDIPNSYKQFFLLATFFFLLIIQKNPETLTMKKGQHWRILHKGLIHLKKSTLIHFSLLNNSTYLDLVVTTEIC